VLYYLVPNLAALDIKADVVHAQPVPLAYMLSTSAYAALYIAILLVGATWIFSRRDFK
jgi:Cu-processing system permease protein